MAQGHLRYELEDMRNGCIRVNIPGLTSITLAGARGNSRGLTRLNTAGLFAQASSKKAVFLKPPFFFPVPDFLA
jgi:hypothetical protein